MLETLYPHILTFHVGTFVVTLGAVLWADHYAFLWMRGTRETLDQKTMGRLHRIVWVCLLGMIMSGALLFYPYKEFLVTLFAFRFKMLCVLLLLVNSFAIHTLLPLATQKSFYALTQKEKIMLGVSGLVSTSAWIGAFVFANMLGL